MLPPQGCRLKVGQSAVPVRGTDGALRPGGGRPVCRSPQSLPRRNGILPRPRAGVLRFAPPPGRVLASAPRETHMRSFQYSDARSHKFWNIDVKGKAFAVAFGKVGSAGQTQTKEFADANKAKAAA